MGAEEGGHRECMDLLLREEERRNGGLGKLEL